MLVRPEQDLGRNTSPSARDVVSRRAFLSTVGSAGLALTALGCGSGHKERTVRSAPVHQPGPPTPSTLRQAIRGQVFERGQPGFTAATQVFNPRFDGVTPSAVARPVDAIDVRNAIRFTVTNNIPVRARSGGHSYAGYSTLANGVVL